MIFFTKIKKLWFPNEEVKAKLVKLKEAYDANLAPQLKQLDESKDEKNTTDRTLSNLEVTLRTNTNRLNELENCFNNKNSLFETLNSLFSNSKSIQSDLNSAYDKLKRNHSKKADYFDWANRYKKIWNTGRKGKKIRSFYNPMSIFNKYNKGDLNRFNSNISSAKSSISDLKSKRSSISSKISLTKSEIGEVKKLCAYVKTQNGKNEIRDQRKEISSLKKRRLQLNSTLMRQKTKIDEVKATIKTSKVDWIEQKRNIKLS